MKIHTEMANGAVSRGYDIEDEETAKTWYARIKAQLTEMGFVGDLVQTDCGEEVGRERINAS